jgi:hypothetical protein
MNLDKRLRQLEAKIQSKQPGCNSTLFIVVPEEMQQGHFDEDSYGPADDEIERYLKHLKDSGQCRDCKGSCAIDWAPDGFKNHAVIGECRSSFSKISMIYCASAEGIELTRWIMNGEIEANEH